MNKQKVGNFLLPLVATRQVRQGGYLHKQELRTLFSICQRSLDFPSNTVQLTAYLCLIDGTTYLVMDK